MSPDRPLGHIHIDKSMTSETVVAVFGRINIFCVSTVLNGEICAWVRLELTTFQTMSAKHTMFQRSNPFGHGGDVYQGVPGSKSFNSW